MITNSLYLEDIANAKNIKGIERIYGKRFLITGATGLVGHHLIDVLMTLPGVEVVAVGRNREKARNILGDHFDSEHFSFIEQDVKQPFDKSIKVDYIIAGASNSHPLAYSKYPIDTLMTNILGAKNALDLAAECGAATLFVSTNDMYGTGIDGHAFKEEDTGKLNLSTPRSCYTESKRASEALCQSYISEKSLTVKIIRLSRLFGPTLLPTDSKASSQFLHKALAGEDIILKSDGNQYFAYAHVTDAVKAMLVVLLNGKSGEAYNAGVDACNVHLKDFAEICAGYCGKKVKFELPDEVEKRGYSPCQYVIMDNTKIGTIGFTPNYDIKTAIYRTLNILKERK